MVLENPLETFSDTVENKDKQKSSYFNEHCIVPLTKHYKYSGTLEHLTVKITELPG